MALPLLLASLFLQGASIAANKAANNRAASARSSALSAERTRQRGLDAEAAAANERAKSRYKDIEGQRTGKAVQLGDYLATATPMPTSAAPDANSMAGGVMPTATNDVVTREIAKKSGQASAFTGQQARSLGALRSFGDLLGEIGTQQTRDAGQIGQINSFKQGSSNALPMELDAANQKGAGLRLLGDILGGIGGIGTTAALTGGLGGGLTMPGKLFGGNSWGPTTGVYG